MRNLKNITGVSIVALTFGSFAQNVFAASFCPNGNAGNATVTGFQKLCNLEIGAVIGSLISFMFVIAAIIALFYLIWGGFRWITSGGDKSNIETARNHILAAIVGLVIIFLSYVILNLVLQFFFGTSLLSNFTLPTLGNSL